MMPLDTAVTSAHVALREATAALLHGRNACRHTDDLDADGVELLAADVAAALEAIAGLIRCTGVEPVTTSAASHDMHALLHSLHSTAGLSRRAAGNRRARYGAALTVAVPSTWPMTTAPDD